MRIKTLTIFKKNLQSYSNSKMSSAILILGPLIIIFVMSIFFQDASLKNINAALFSEEDDEFKQNFIDGLNERAFSVYDKFSLESCKRDVIDGSNNVCIYLTKNDSLLDDYENHDVKIYVDFSKTRVVWGIIGTIQGMVERESYSQRSVAIQEMKSNLDNLDSNLEKIEGELTNAISTIELINQNIVDASSNLNNLKIALPEIKSSLVKIKNSGLLFEPHTSNILEIIAEIDSSTQTISDLEGDLAQANRINSISSRLTSVRNSVILLRSELGTLKTLNVDRLVDPIVLSYYPVGSDEVGGAPDTLETLDYFFPSFLIFFIMFSSLLFSTTVFIKERKSKAYLRNIISVRSGFSLIFGNFLTILFISLLQVAIVLGVSIFFLNIDILSNISALLGIVFISVTFFSLLGILIGSLFNSYESAITASVSFALLSLIFSSTIIPVETLPKVMNQIIKVSPLTLLESKIRVVTIFGSPLSFGLIEALALSFVFLISILLMTLLYQRNRENEI